MKAYHVHASRSSEMIACFMRFLGSELEHRRNFELVESLLTVILRVWR